MAVKNVNLGGDTDFRNGVDPDFYLHWNDTFDEVYNKFHVSNW